VTLAPGSVAYLYCFLLFATSLGVGGGSWRHRCKMFTMRFRR
jgi:hypothetical protein